MKANRRRSRTRSTHHKAPAVPIVCDFTEADEAFFRAGEIEYVPPHVEVFADLEDRSRRPRTLRRLLFRAQAAFVVLRAEWSVAREQS